MKEIKLNNEQIDILKIIVTNELAYYDIKEEINPEDEEYIEALNELLEKLKANK